MLKPTAFLLLAGLAVGQPPAGTVTQEDVKRLAERLVRLDPSLAPPLTPQQFGALRKLLEANPALREEAAKRLEELQSLSPEKQQAKLAELQKRANDPEFKKKLEQLSPSTGDPQKTTADPVAKTDQGNAAPKSDRDRTPRSKSNPTPKGTESPRGETGESRSSSDQPRLAPADSKGQPAPQGQGAPKTSATPPASPSVPGAKGYEKFVRLWEQNVGPLKDMPAVQQLAKELFRGQADPSAAGDGGALADLFDLKMAADLLKGLPEPTAASGSWSLPDLGSTTGGLSAPRLPNTSISAPTAPSAGGVGLVVGLLILAALVFAIVRLLPKLTANSDPRPVPGLGPWPLDPRSIETRADLVRAFEYLSVLLNGNPARAYSHEAAAAALRQAVPDAADAAGPLAEAYALARYTPADRPLTADEIAAARRHLCRLAGVPAT